MKKIILLFALVLNFSLQAQCWESVSSSGGGTLAIKTDGTLWRWGLVNFLPTQVNIPTQMGTDNDWKSIHTGLTTSFAIKNNGTLWGWGQSIAPDGGNQMEPSQITTATDWKSVSPGSRHRLAIKTDGSLWSWGEYNVYGELGNGTTVSNNIPTQIGNATDWKWISAGLYSSFAIKTDGTLWAWGDNSSGHLGISQFPNTSFFTVPTQVGTDTNWEKVYTNNGHSHGIKTDGSIWAWGSNLYGRLGDGTQINRNSPIQIGTDTDWKSIALSDYSTFYLKNNGNLFACGLNTVGHFGNGTDNNSSILTQTGIGSNWEEISAGRGNIIATRNDNLLFATGLNAWGGLGNGTNINSNIFVPVNTVCPPIPITANNDTGTSLNGIASAVVANVLENDTYNNLPATTSNVNLSFVSATHAGITLDSATGAVNVNATVPVGNYTLIYQICDPGNSLNCRTATVSITVNPQTIDAVNDNFISTPINTLTGGVTASVLLNDVLYGQAVNPLDVTIALINNSGILGATISSTGKIYIPAGTLIGSYTMSYRICSISNPALCDNATFKIKINEQIITTPELVYAIRANSTVFQSELQSTGKIIISGGFSKYNDIEKKCIARLNTDLTLDESFLGSGPIPADQPAYEIAIQPDNKILLVGNFKSFNGSQSGKGITRLNSDGTPDQTFNFNGTGFGDQDSPRCIAIQADGKILIGGSMIKSYNGTAIENMIRLNLDGTLDTTFNFHFNHATSSGGIHKILVQPNGKIIVSGNIRNTLQNTQPNLFRLNSNGSIDPDFIYGRTTGNVYNCGACISAMPIQNLLLQTDGKIIVVGIFDTYRGVTKNNIFRINTDGSDDTTFSIGISADLTVKDVVLEPSGKLIIAGVFANFNGFPQAKLARLNRNGSLDTTFSSGTGPTHNFPVFDRIPSVYDLKRQLDGKIIVSGYFTHYNGISATNITRIAPETPGGQARPSQNDNNELDLPYANGTIKIYPNPSQGIFTFDLSGLDQKFDKIEIYNTLGQLIFQNRLTQKLTEIDLSRVESGTYFAKISNESNSIQKVLIKK